LKLVVDAHTHTISSGHAYSTVQENAREAVNKGIEMFVVTDHGPSLEGAPSLLHFANLKAIPDEIYGVRVAKGVEANIIDYSGNLDVPAEYLRRLDFVIASLHDICIKPATIEQHTNALIKVLENPYVDAVAHPGNPVFQVDIEKVVKAAAENMKLIEINNHSFDVRKGCEENCEEFARICCKMGVRMICSSDAHISFEVGSFDRIQRLFDKVKVPESLVLCTSVEKFEEYILQKKRRLNLKRGN